LNAASASCTERINSRNPTLNQDDPRNDGRGWRLLPIPGTEGPLELGGDDVQAISRALLLLAVTAEKINFATAADPPPIGSGAATLYRGPEAGYALEGFLTMQYAIMSAMDHVRSFVALIRTPTVRSTALATVARGGLESLARSWYLLSRESNEDFVYRVLSLLRSDLKYAELLGEDLRTRNGDPVDPVERRSFYADELKRLNLPAAAKNELGLMVAAMLDAELDQRDGRMRYSALSSIAHAHRLGVNNFVATGTNGDVAGLAAPRPVVMDVVGQLTAATYGTMRTFVAFYGDQVRHIELLESAFQRALRALLPVAESVWPSAGSPPV